MSREARLHSPFDAFIDVVDRGLHTVFGHHHASRPTPEGDGHTTVTLEDHERRLAGALMRVNHVGEVCAQALYAGQALSTPNPQLRVHLERAGDEETDHLAWTEQRMAELGARPSWLNPFWYAGAFAMGVVAGRLGDRAGLGFVIETERQVEQHLASHLERLPAQDGASRAIVEQMRQDEARHADDAEDRGGLRPPAPVRWLMRAAAKVMTTTAHHV
jgi:ubiquinone biosynthesis monooxygenase Coq7